MIFFCSSCATPVVEIGENETGRKIIKDLEHRDNSEYANQLTTLADVYLKTQAIKEITLPAAQQEYLYALYDGIVVNNNVLLNKDISPQFHIIKEPIPFCFSVPGGHLFLSSGLISRYLGHELVFVAVLTFEIIKMHRNIYLKNIIVPTGHISLERMLSLTRIPTELKNSVGQLTYYSMIRAGYDAVGYLMWLQLQNKNILDFKLLVGDSQGVAMEEFHFKQFIIKRGLIAKDLRYDVNSSPRFYSFLGHLKKEVKSEIGTD